MEIPDTILQAALDLARASVSEYDVALHQDEPPAFQCSALSASTIRLYGVIAGDRVKRFARCGMQRRIGISLYPVTLRDSTEESVQKYQAAVLAMRDALLAYRERPLPGTVFRLLPPGRSGEDAYHIVNAVQDPQLETGGDVLATRINLIFTAIQE